MPNRVDKNQRLAIARKVRWIVAGLVVLAAAIAGTHWWLAASRAPAPGGSAWLVHLEFRLRADRAGATVTLAPPWDSPAARLYSQQLTLDGLQLSRPGHRHGESRRITMSALRSGALALAADFSIHRINRGRKSRPEHVKLEPDDRQRYLGEEPGIDPASTAVHTALERITAAAKGNGDLVPRIYRYVRGQIGASAVNGADTAAAALDQRSRLGPGPGSGNGGFMPCGRRSRPSGDRLPAGPAKPGTATLLGPSLPAEPVDGI